MTDLTKKVVKEKKLQKIGDNSLCVIIPRKWIEEMGWNQDTRLILEFLPHRKTMILSGKVEKIQPINSEKGIAQRDKAREELSKKAEEEDGKKDSNFIPV